MSQVNLVGAGQVSAPAVRIRNWRQILSSALLVVGIGVGAYRSTVLREAARQFVIVIPEGTAERIEAGAVEGAAPHEIELILGIRDVLVIRNEDSAWHNVGPYGIAPGHTLVQRYSYPGTILQSCSITPTRQVEIVIRER